MKRILIGFIGLFLVTSAWAGDAAKLNFIGFSKDGRYLAFQQYGFLDGKGTTFANTYFIDVTENKYAAKPIESGSHTYETSLSKSAIQQINLGRATDQIKQLGIVADNRGEHVIAHQFNDIGVNAKQVRFALGTPLAGLTHTPYQVDLQETAEAGRCEDLGKRQLLTLTLTQMETKQAKILQKDQKIPKSRDCPLGYRIQDVYVYQEKFIVVFLNLLTPGFEGQNMRYLAITGNLQ